MAKKLKPGDEINGYTITDVFGPGAMAISYAARGRTGQKVFFKQYKSPSVTVEWYRPYVQYQKELNLRIAESPARNYCVRAIDAFEEVWGGRTYFQVFEFVSAGADLGGIFEREAEANGGRAPTPPFAPEMWNRHVIWAKVLMSGIHTLHSAQVAHVDLKPDNAFLIEDPSIAAGYQLKLIDVDFSILTDHQAPWHGFMGYVGTDNYRSPEHFTAGATPGAASDVFTCGLMLYQLLAGQHPYWSEDQSEYAKKVLAYGAPRPVLGGTMPAPASNEAVAEILYRCLAPRPQDRPTAAQVRDVLTGRGASAPAVPAAPAEPSIAAPAAPAAPAEPYVAAPAASAAPAEPYVAAPAASAAPAEPSIAAPAASAAPAEPSIAAPAAPAAPAEPSIAAPAAPAAPAEPPVAAPAAPAPPPSPAVTADAPPVAPPVAAPPPVDPAAVAPGAVPAGGAPLASDRIQLVGESGQAMSLGVRTPLGKHIVRQFGEDSNVWDSEQLIVERGADGTWQVTPVAGTTNETLVNGEAVTAPRPLRDGDVIAVGRAARGIARLPLTARPA